MSFLKGKNLESPMSGTFSNLKWWIHRLHGHSAQNLSFEMLYDDICKHKTKVCFIIYLTPSFRSFQIFHKEEIGICSLSISLSMLLYVSNICITVFEEEVKRSEMWKLTCQECKVNTIRVGKRKKGKKKKKVKQWRKNRPYWSFVVAFENLELPFGNVFNKGNTNMSEM